MAVQLQTIMESMLWRSPDFQSHDVGSPISMPAEPAWTTARCNRLLRPLSSKIALLRKSNGTRRTSGDEEENESPPELCHISGGPKLNAKTGRKGVPTPISSLGVHGLNWDPSPRPRKKGEATSVPAIQSKLQGEPSARIAAGFVNVERPLLPSIIAQNCRSENAATYGQEKKISQTSLHGANARSRDICRRYAKADYPDCWKLLEGIHAGLEILLKATSKHLTGNRNGARSLLSTCLRKIPEYISLQEHWLRAQDPESVAEVSPSIYGELEMVGARTLQGSHALQEVVRAHGVDLIGSAVMDGLICFPVASRLVKLCLHLQAYDEGQHLVECILRNKSFPRPTSRDDVLFSKELSLLDQFAILTGRFGFLYRKLTTLFENRLLPIEWISSPDMIERWSGVIQCISEGNSDARDAGILLRTVILMSEGQPFTSIAHHIHRLRFHSRTIPSDTSEGWSQSGPSGETVSFRRHMKCPSSYIEGETPKTGLRLLAALCALEFAQSLTTSSNSANTPVLQDLALEAHQIIETREFCAQSMERSRFCADGPCLVLLAAGLSSSMAKTDEMALQWCLNTFECTHLSDHFHSKAASFLSVVACWRGQALASDGFEFMQEIVQKLLGVFSAGCCLPETRTLVGRIATTAAIQYASITSKPRHLSWALDTETRVNGMTVGLACQTPRRIPKGGPAKARLGFRWEEGICEWVSGTPGVPKPKPIIYRDVNTIVSDTEPAGKPKPTENVDSSPNRVRYSGEVSSPSTSSTRELRRERLVPNHTSRSYSGTFLRVEVDRCSQASIQTAQDNWQQQIKQDHQSNTESGADELSNSEAIQDRSLRCFEKQAQLALKSQGLTQRIPKRRKERRGLGKQGICAAYPRHRAQKSLVKRAMEAGGSEDELSFR